MHTISGCPQFQLNPVFVYFGSGILKFIIIALFFAVGLYSMVYGRAHILKVQLVLNFIFITFTVMYLLCIVILRELFRPWLMTLTIMVCAIASGGVSYLLTTKRGKWGVALLSA